MNIIDARNNQICYNARTKTFVTEISIVGGPCLEDGVAYYDVRSDDSTIRFFFTKCDYGYGDESIAGWNYKSLDKEYHLLIIND